MQDPTREGWPRRAAWIALVLAAALFAAQALRLLWGKSYSLDELTYAHGAWAVAHGQLPYRDFFFHHPPLLLQLGAAAFLLVGDDPSAGMLALRLTMLPSLLLACAAAWLLARERCGRWALLAPVLALSCFEVATLGTEVRPDPLACALWLASLATLRLRRGPARGRAALAGALAVAAAWASQKVLVYGAPPLLGALALDLGVNRRRGLPPLLAAPGWFLLGVGAGALGPVAYLSLSGSWGPLVTWCVDWPLALQRGGQSLPWTQSVRAFAEGSGWLVPLALLGVVDALRARAGPWSARPDVLALASLPLTLLSVVVQVRPYPYSLIPFAWLLALFAARGLVAADDALAGWSRRRRGLARAALLVCVLGWLLAAGLRLEERLAGTRAPQEALFRALGEALAPDDPVYDNSGSAVTHPHVSFYFFTNQFLRASQAEMLAREVPAAILARGCTAYLPDLRAADLPPALQAFLQESFQPYTGDLWLWGRAYAPADPSGVEGTFLAVRAGRYFVHPPEALAGGALEVDGQVVTAPVFDLTRGEHRVRRRGAGGFSILWLPRSGPYAPAVGSRPTFSRLF